MYSGVLERVYKKEQTETEMPEFFSDLNLNLILRELQEKGQEYDIRGLYFRYPEDYETVCYRRGVYREIRRKSLEESLGQFSHKMRESRRYEKLYRRAENGQQWRMYLFNRISEYITGVFFLREELTRAAAESEGLSGLLAYVQELCERPLWKECREETGRICGMLSDLRFRLSIAGGNLKVITEPVERYYFDYIRKLFPERFRSKEEDGAVPREYLLPSPFATEEMLSYLECEIVQMYQKSRPDFFDALAAFSSRFGEIIEPEVYRIEEELQFYLVFSEFQTEMEKRGCVFCEPQVKKGGSFSVQQVYDLALARKNRWVEKEVVSNSVQYNEGERFFLVTGPNQGGKTTFARSLGQLVYFAMMGLDVPAETAVLPYFEGILTHFSVEESMESGRGKLKEELVRLQPMMQEEYGNRFVILNELFTTAATYDAFIMGKRVLEHFSGQGCLGVYVTHIAELADACPGTVSLTALADEHDHRKRTFRIVRREAEGTGYAGDIVEKHRLGYEALCARLEEGGIYESNAAL